MTAPLRSEVTVTLASGKSFSGTLEYLDDFNVALRDAAGEYHSFSREPRSRWMFRIRSRLTPSCSRNTTDADMHNVLAYLVTLK